MRLLITGGGGFVGARLARTLLARGTLAGQPVDHIVLADQVEIIRKSGVVVVQSVSCDAGVLTNRSGRLAAACQMPYFRPQTMRIGQQVGPTIQHY